MSYPRTYHFPFSPGATRDDKIQSDFSALINTPIVITEKLDGGNVSLTRNGVFARSHSTFSANPWDVYIWHIQRRISKDIEPNWFLYGENLTAIHSIEYEQLTTPFYLFHVAEDDVFWSWDKVLELAYLLDLTTVPVLFEGQVATVKELTQLVTTLT